MAKPNGSETPENNHVLLIAYGFTWVFWISEALAARGLLGSSIIVDFCSAPKSAAWGPFVSAILLTLWYQKRRVY